MRKNKKQDKESSQPYKHCLNCGTELKGDFCHKCGQHVASRTPTVWGFIIEYINNAFIWDSRFFQTIYTLVRRPGHLTNEFLSGKLVSQEHPLKLNMFLLFAFVTLFFFFRDKEDLNNSLHVLTRNETAQPVVKVQLLAENEAYMSEMMDGQFDTVKLYAPYLLFESCPDVIRLLDKNVTVESETIGVWTAAVPHKLIEDEVIALNDDGSYHFTVKDNTPIDGLELVEKIWSNMVTLTTRYIPIFILLTTPFLAILLRLLFRKKRPSHLRNFVFSLHYISYLELLIILIYILHLLASPPVWLMQWIILIASSVYLSVAIRKVYDIKKWPTAISKAIFTNFGYLMILFALFCIICFVSIVHVAHQQAL